MGRDSEHLNDEEQPEQLTRLDRVLSQVLDTLEHGRDDIFDIAQDCHEIEVALPTGRDTRNKYNKMVNLLKQKYAPILN